MSSPKPLETPAAGLPIRIRRQSLSNRIVHWLVALSTFALFFSGFGQMPMYARYGLAGLPGMAWAADYGVTLVIHYLAGAVLTFAVIYHIVHALLTRRFTILPRKGDFKESVQIIAAMLGRGQEPPSHKYLAEQRLAYAYIGLNTLVIVVTGIVKVAKNVPGASIDPALVFWSTTAHNAAAMLLLLGVIGHFAAFAIKANRALLPAMFDGTVERAYAEHRHPLWYRQITVNPHTPLPDVAETDVSTKAA
ncbi:MAG: cytochrome b/b6 domain-containing protein [Coriobacteriia bacterium]|nr:cytochrome b/b6 domain-containing protein [Coriobacteriia bacterium]